MAVGSVFGIRSSTLYTRCRCDNSLLKSFRAASVAARSSVSVIGRTASPRARVSLDISDGIHCLLRSIYSEGGRLFVSLRLQSDLGPRLLRCRSVPAPNASVNEEPRRRLSSAIIEQRNL